MCYIGIDGGGTKTVGVALDSSGNVLCRAEEKSINYCSVGVDEAVLALSRIVSALEEAAGCPAQALAVGSSALDERIRDALYAEFTEKIKADAHLSHIQNTFIYSDAYMALRALTDEERGAVLICGTGIMGLAENGGTLHSVAGWGDLFGDRGSGYAIARDGLIAALDYTDGLCPEGEALFLAMCEFFSISSAAQLIQTVYAEDFDKSRLAAFCPLVFAIRERGDACAARILDNAVHDVVRYCVSLGDFLGKRPFKLGFYGSVLTKNKRFYKAVAQELKRLLPQADIIIPETAAEDAAARLALRRVHS